MGGGAAMRVVSKVAGFTGGVVHAGIRGAEASAALLAEQAVRKSSISVSAMLSSFSSRGGANVVAGERMPRLVFPGVPSIEEAKEATLELRDTLDKVYLCSARELVATDQLSGLSLASDNHSLALETNEALNVSSPVIRAFNLLSTSPEVQNVVASIASDQAVFEAVMRNPELQEFMQSNENKVEFQETLLGEKSEEAKNLGNWFTGMFKKVKLSTVNLVIQLSSKSKLTTVYLVTQLSSKFNEMFGPSDVDRDDEKAGHKDGTLERSLIGLAIMVVMVVLFKRI